MMKRILLTALCVAAVMMVPAMPAAADGEQASQAIDDVEQADRSAVTTIPPMTYSDMFETVPPAAVQTIPPFEGPAAVQTIPPFEGSASLQTVPPFEGSASLQTIPPVVRPTFPPLEVQTFAPAAAQFAAPDVQIDVSDNSHVYVLGPDGSIQMVPEGEEQTVLRAVGMTASSSADALAGQQQYGGSLFSAEGAAGSYALTALCAFLGAAGGSALTWAVINRKKKNGNGKCGLSLHRPAPAAGHDDGADQL